jgi:hypothetical protein
MESMLHRLKPPMLVTIVAGLLLVLTPLTLRGVAPEFAAAAIVLLAMLAGIGVGASVTSPGPRHR